jgi:hypothetical protein
MEDAVNYPDPDHNPACQCKGNPLRAFWCQFGHMLECHFPYTCTEAGCGHLERYDFEPEELERLQQEARGAIVAGQLPPYQLDENSQIQVDAEAMRIARDGGSSHG